MDNSEERCIFIFDNPRNRSHLFFRLMATNPELKPYHHAYVNAGVLGPEKIHYEIYGNNPKRHELVKKYWEPLCQDRFTHYMAKRDLLEAIENIQSAGKIPMCNEHCSYIIKREILIDRINNRLPSQFVNRHKNPTILPNELWSNLTPIIIIRHPALAIPSLYRATAGIPALADLDPMENHNYWFATLAWSRMIFDSLLRNSPRREAIVVDGEDVCTRTEEVTEAVCTRLGLDPDDVKDAWEPWGESWADKNLSHPLFKEMTRTMWESHGVNKHTAPDGIDIEAAVQSIQEEFGADVAEKMRTAIKNEMTDYEYLSMYKV